MCRKQIFKRRKSTDRFSKPEKKIITINPFVMPLRRFKDLLSKWNRYESKINYIADFRFLNRITSIRSANHKSHTVANRFLFFYTKKDDCSPIESHRHQSGDRKGQKVHENDNAKIKHCLNYYYYLTLSNYYFFERLKCTFALAVSPQSICFQCVCV